MSLPIEWTYREISEFYKRVRTLLDNISIVSLPDEYMDTPEKAPFAEAYIKSKVVNWQELNEAQQAIFESAIVYKTASLFESLVSSNSIKKKQIPTATLEYFSNKDIQINGLSLSDSADVLISRLINKPSVDFVGFLVTN